MPELLLRGDDGTVIDLDISRWHGEARSEDLGVLVRSLPPVVDLGCGPGRLVVALGERGVPALGVDAAPHAVATARSRGAMVLERSVFDRLPGAGRWGSVLLLDGNIGIGGDPVTLLARARALLRRGGRVLVEIDPPGTGTRTLEARLERAGVAGPTFPWAVVDAAGLPSLAARAGLVVTDLWEEGGRWFSQLDVS